MPVGGNIGSLVEDKGEQDDGEPDVHRRAHDEDLEPFPLRLREVLVRLAGPLVVHRLAGHLDEAAEGDGADAVIRAAAGKPEQSRSKPNRERQHADANASGGEVMAQLVNKNEHADHKSESKERRHDLEFLTLSILSSKPG